MNHNSGALRDDSTDLRQMLMVLWQERISVTVVVLMSTAIAIAYAFLAKEIYRAEALVQPRVDAQPGSALGAIAAQLGSLGDFTGLSMPGGGDRSVTIATLRSRAVIEPFIEQRKLLPKIFASKWDEVVGAWKSADPKRIPTTWHGYNEFTRKMFKVVEDRKTNLVLVSIEWSDPQEAQLWVTELIARTNDHLRTKAVQEGEKNLKYLYEQAGVIGQVELRQALYGLIEGELKKLMVAKGGEEFALKTIDAAVVPRKRTYPQRAQVILLGFFGGLALAASFVYARGKVRSYRSASNVA